jgi:predicted Zn-dependent peptidase
MKKLLFSFALVLLAVSMYAQSKYQWKEGLSGNYKYKYVTNDPVKARYYTLSNGLTVVLVVNKKTPRVQTLFGTRAGSNQDPKTNTGLAHYLEHMLFKGTSNYGSLDWSKEKPLLDRIDALYAEYGKIPTTDTAARKAKYHEIDSVSGEAAKYAIANEYDKMMSAMGAQGTNAHTSVEETVYEEDIPANAIDKYLTVQAERFRNPVLRLFHTELEAVYEEKNRGLDNDGRKVFETTLATVFPTHNYGQQTTIGTVEHLKNPSLIEIRNFYNKYYVPNNMALVMVGDINPDELIKKIDAAFKWWQPKPVEPYNPAPEAPITAPIVKDVYGPSAENLWITWRLPGVNDTRSTALLELISNIMSNGKAGLVDLNINKQQKLLRAGAFNYNFKDYAMLICTGSPKKDQTLDDVKKILLEQVDLLRKGDFDESLIASTVANYKLQLLEASKDNNTIANDIMDQFIKTAGKLWDKHVGMIDIMKGFTEKDVMDFANQYLGDGYVVVNKHKGKDTTIVKVPKPAITPVPVNREAQSEFLKSIEKMPSTPVKPLFLDFKKNIQQTKLGAATVYYSQNKDNDIFRLYYRFGMGTWNNKKLGLAAQYLQFLGTDKQTSADISKEFYKLACSFNVNAGTEFTTISITGLQENFGKAVALFESLIANCKADEEALKKMIARTQKNRSDAKLNKGTIMNGLQSYALYGAKNPFNYTLSNDELAAIKGDDLVAILHDLMNYKHDIIYYGPQPLAAITPAIGKLHKIPAAFKANPEKVDYKMQQQNSNQVLFADYDMVQAEVMWVHTADMYDPALVPTIRLFNSYFGAGGMSGIVFQTIRESKALAYSTYAVYNQPAKKENPNVFIGYVGTQADKIHEAIKSMNELIMDLPKADKLLEDSKTAIRKDIETERITDEAVIFNYLGLQRLGIDYDVRKNIYEKVNSLTFDDIKNFAKKEVAGRSNTYLIVASDKKVNTDELKQYGEVKKLTLEEIFGY